MIINSDFKPAWWLSNPHVQTMWGAVLRPHPEIKFRRERFDLPDGDFIDIDWAEPKNLTADSPIIIVLHGLGGSIESHYASNVMHTIYESGWRGVFMHYRGCSDQPNLKPISYHSGYTDDVIYLVESLNKRFSKAKMAVIGYSLGGNLLLKWLGESKHNNPITTAIAISVPFQLESAADTMLSGFSRFYQWYILRGIRKKIAMKFSNLPCPIDLNTLHYDKTFWEFDNHYTAPIHGFKNVLDYYSQASSRKHLPYITKPTLILHAKDDPFMSADVIPKIDDLSPSTTLEISEYGGHVGFIAGKTFGKPKFWLEQRIVAHLSEYFEIPTHKNVDIAKQHNSTILQR